MVRAMDGPVDMLLIFFKSELMRVPIDRRGLSFAADNSPLTRSEIRAGGEGQLKKRNVRAKNLYAPKSAVNGTGLSSRFRRAVLKESRCAKIQTSTLPLGALHRRCFPSVPPSFIPLPRSTP